LARRATVQTHCLKVWYPFSTVLHGSSTWAPIVQSRLS